MASSARSYAVVVERPQLLRVVLGPVRHSQSGSDSQSTLSNSGG